MAQPVLIYNLTWGTGNVFQKLSGKTYVNPSGQTVDCSSVSVTFSSSRHFKKFYATAVKSGNNYGFENDVLVDLTTGTLLYELTERDANVNFTFTINTSSLTDGSGEYRIGLYVQDDDGIWNYEYFLLEANNLQLESSNNLLLQVPVQIFEEEPDYGFVVNGNTLTITDSSKLRDGIINSDDYLYVGCSLSDDNYQNLHDFLWDKGTIDIRMFNKILRQQFGVYNEGLSVLLTDGTNNYQVLLNENIFNYMEIAAIINIDDSCEYFFVIRKDYLENNLNILNETNFYYTIYGDMYEFIEFDDKEYIEEWSNTFLSTLPYEDRTIEEIIDGPYDDYFDNPYQSSFG